MTKEPKEELVKMDWREVITKRKQIKDKTRRKPPTRLAGGNRPSQSTEDYIEHWSDDSPELDNTEENEWERQSLVNSTRSDLMDKVMDLIGSMKDDELIDLLVGSQGNIEVGSIQVKDNR
jgi:hypothetical protein